MALVAPFRALHYNLAKVPHPEDVVTPPYDVIPPKEREAFAARHPNNMVHLILPQPLPGDDRLKNRYNRAAGLFYQWQRDQVLIRDVEPAYYYWETEFPYEGRIHTRTGLAAAVRLEPFNNGVIRPHEQTFSKAKEDRLELLKNAGANFSPIYALFQDPGNQILAGLARSLPSEPMMAFTDAQGYFQRVFRVTDPRCLAEAYQAFKPLPLFIADGHHRYETSLNYRKWMKERYPGASPTAPFNFILMYLSNLSDPDMVIMMAHRLLAGPRLKKVEETALLRRLGEYFEVIPLTAAGLTGEVYGEMLQQRLAATRPGETAFIMVGFGMRAWLLRLRPGARQNLLARHMHPALAQLDVAVLNYLIFEKVLGLDAQALDDQQTCKYNSKISGALSALQQGEATLAFLLNPTRIEQVQEVASAGLIMPRKSTYFFPKVPSGIVLNPLDPEEQMALPA